MPQQINRVKSAQQNLVDLINTGSTYVFTGSEFNIGLPTPYTPIGPDTSNTEVLLTAINGSGFVGIKNIKYRRLALGATRPGARVNYTVTAQDTIESLKEAIAQEHNLVSADFELTGSLPTYSGEVSIFMITPVPGSLLYTDSLTVNVTFA